MIEIFRKVTVKTCGTTGELDNVSSKSSCEKLTSGNLSFRILTALSMFLLVPLNLNEV